MIIIFLLGTLIKNRRIIMTRYEVFVKVIETGSFTKAAEILGYTQSAVSQMVRTLEAELDAKLLERSKGGIMLTKDGMDYYPCINSISIAFKNLEEKHKEILGLNQSVINIGTFTSISRTWFPHVMNDFKKLYPDVKFQLHQGEYTSIEEWIKNGTVDFGFVYPDAVSGLKTIPLYTDFTKAVLPPNHHLCQKETVSLADLAHESFILLDEGVSNLILKTFASIGETPNIQYTIYDDYTVLAMIEQGLGVSVMYSPVLEGTAHKVEVRPLKEDITRTVALALPNDRTPSVAAKKFADFVMKNFNIE